MPMENIGLGGVFTFDEKPGVEAIGRASAAYEKLIQLSQQLDKQTSKGLKVKGGGGTGGGGGATAGGASMFAGMGAGASQLGMAARNATMAVTPLAIAMGFAAKTAIDFEKQMGAVAAVTGANETELGRLRAAAKKAGAETVFTATEAGMAMENLAKAGFDVNQTLAALPGVMAAAAAESVPLEQATDIVAQVLRGMNIEVEKSTHVANVLAKAAASTNTSIPELGESFKYGGAAARSLGYDLESTAAAFGTLADAGLKGSIGGTALSSMLTHLIKPAKKGAQAMQELGITIDDGKGNMKALPNLVQHIVEKLGSVRQTTERARLATLIFGIEGKRAYDAFDARGSAALQNLTKELGKASDGIGYAQELAQKRLDNFAGAFKLFGSATESLAIEVFGPLLKPFTDSLKGATSALSGVVITIQSISAAGNDAAKRTDAITSATSTYGSTTVQIALGVIDAIKTIREGWEWITTAVQKAGVWLEKTIGSDNVRTLSQYAVVFAFIAAAAVPVMGALMGLGFILTSVIIPAFSGLLAIAAPIFWPLLAVITTFAADGGEAFADLWMAVKYSFEQIRFAIFGAATESKTDWMEVGTTILNVVKALLVSAVQIATGIVLAFTTLMTFLIGWAKVVWDIVSAPFRAIWELVTRIGGAFMDMFNGDVLRGLAKLGLALMDYVLYPVRTIVKALIHLAEAIPGVEVAQGLKTFANEGITGFVFPETADPTATNEATAATDMKAAEKKAAKQAPNVTVNAKIEDKRKLEIDNKLTIDGSQIAVAAAKHKQEINERAGFKASPWQRRMALEQGAAPVKGGS